MPRIGENPLIRDGRHELLGQRGELAHWVGAACGLTDARVERADEAFVGVPPKTQHTQRAHG